MVYLDFVFLMVMLAVWGFNHALLKVDVSKIKKQNNFNVQTVNKLEPHIELFLFMTDFIHIILYAGKFGAGLLYVFATSCPPKKDYELLYKGRVGHHMWRVLRVKYMRKRLNSYFVLSTVAVLFQLLSGLVIDGCYYLFSEFDTRLARIVLTTIIAIY